MPANTETVSEWARSNLHIRPNARQKAVLDSGAHRLIVCCSRQWGKTTVIAVKALHTAVSQPGSEIVVVSKSLEDSALLIDEVRQRAARLGLPIPGGDLSLLLPNGSKIFANFQENSRANIVIVDDAALVHDHVIASACPANAKLWLLSTPHGQSGLFYNVWHAIHLNDWFRVKATIEDSPYAGTPFIKEQKRLFPLHFRQDFYCEFTPVRGRLLNSPTCVPPLQCDPIDAILK